MIKKTWSIWWMKVCGWNRSTWRKLAAILHCPWQISNDLAWDRFQAAAVRSWVVTIWATALPIFANMAVVQIFASLSCKFEVVGIYYSRKCVQKWNIKLCNHSWWSRYEYSDFWNTGRTERVVNSSRVLSSNSTFECIRCLQVKIEIHPLKT